MRMVALRIFEVVVFHMVFRDVWRLLLLRKLAVSPRQAFMRCPPVPEGNSHFRKVAC